MRRQLGIRAFDFLAWVAIVVSLSVAFHPYVHHRGPGIWFVSEAGSDVWGDGTRTNPWRTIQYAADRAVAGDRIRVLPGVYSERIHVRNGGREGLPLIIEADVPGSVLVTWALSTDAYRTFTWKDEGGGIFSASSCWPIHFIAADGNQLYRVPWGGIDQLRKIVARPQAMGAFWSDANTLFVALQHGQHPEDANLVWHRRVPPPREWGEFKSANLWVEADHVVIRGIRFEFGIGSAIRVWNAQHLIVDNCEFSGCTIGVLTGHGAKQPSDIRIENCWYHNTPQGDWIRGWLEWKDVYAAYSSSTLCMASDRPVAIHNNLVTDFGDGIRCSPDVDPSVAGQAELTGNWFAFGTDDVFELDGPGHQVLLRDNVAVDVHEGISFSPLSEGPVVIQQNLFWNPVGGVNGSQLKFIPPDNWKVKRVQGIRLEENIFCGEWLSWRTNITVSDVNLTDNYFEVDRRLDPNWPPGATEEGNAYRLPRDPDGKNAGQFLQMLTKREVDSKFINLAERFKAKLKNRPGPTWLRWEDHPSTSRLLKLIDSE